jgi:hypothetical protein
MQESNLSSRKVDYVCIQSDFISSSIPGGCGWWAEKVITSLPHGDDCHEDTSATLPIIGQSSVTREGRRDHHYGNAPAAPVHSAGFCCTLSLQSLRKWFYLQRFQRRGRQKYARRYFDALGRILGYP